VNENEIQNKDPEKGIGLKNIRRRLDLTFPGKYELHTDLKGDQYIVKLNLIGL
jgi:sensor histidine kinase YesM